MLMMTNITAMNTVMPWTTRMSRLLMALMSENPRPGMAKSVSITTVPPRSAPKVIPTIVIRLSELGRNAWRNRMYRSLIPFARAERM